MLTIELGRIPERTEDNSCPGQQYNRIKSSSNSGGMPASDALTTTGRSSSSCTHSRAAITSCTPRARSAASPRNSGAATIRSGVFFAAGQPMKSGAWIARPENCAHRLARSAARRSKDIPCPFFRSSGVFVAGTPISGCNLTAVLNARESPMCRWPNLE